MKKYLKASSIIVLLSIVLVMAFGITSQKANAAAICSPATSISSPFSFDGAGDRCWKATSLCTYINSWNLTTLEVNGTAYTNLYVVGSSIAPVNGAYTIHYNSSVAWGHFEIGGTCSGGGAPTNTPVSGPTATRTKTPVAGATATPINTPTTGPTQNPNTSSPDGYAAGTTGGGNATAITVSSASAFKSAVSNNNPAVIIVNGRINMGGDVSIGSNKTIRGANASSGLYGGAVKVGGTNYIFKNLTIGPNTAGDAMEVSGATKVFITKCEFYDGADGSLDIVRQADYVTVSWSKFYYVNQTTHKNTMLIGNGDDVTADAGKLHVTLHHNWFAQGAIERMPRVRFGYVHIYNNYYNSVGNNYVIGVGVQSHIRVENSYFDNVKSPWKDYGGVGSGAQFGWSNLQFVGTSAPSFISNSFPVFSLPYSFSADAVANVKSVVTAGAGNVFP